MATCGTMVEGNVVSFMCDLPTGHDGPHRAVENDRSVRERKRWEAEQQTPDQRHADSGLAQFQGRAETTAERYTENPTPVPQTRQQREEARFDTPEAAALERETIDLARQVEAEQEDEDLSAHERPIVYTEAAEGTAFRPASTAEAKVAGIETAPRSRQFMDCDPSTCDDEVGHSQGPGCILYTEPTKQREGDQPLPTPTQGEYVQDRIIAKIEALRPQIGDEAAEVMIQRMVESKQVGMQRYGTPLQTFNGRDCLQDLAEELRDAYVYVNSLMQAREAQRDDLVEVVAKALRVDDPLADLGYDDIAEIAVDAILKATGGFGT